MKSRVQVHRSGERLAVHLLCLAGTHQCVIVSAHHEGIPLGASLRPGKAKIHVRESARHCPVVEVRSLDVYEQASRAEDASLISKEQTQITKGQTQGQTHE